MLVSAKTGEGLALLQQRIADELQRTFSPVTFFLPFSQYGLMSQLRPLGRVLSENHTDEGTELTMVLSQADRDRAVSRLGVRVVSR